MAAEIKTTEPPEIIKGDTLKWNRQDISGDFPATTYTLTYEFRPLGTAGVAFTIAAAADGANYSVSEAKATTAAYTAGAYEWAAYADDGTERYRLDSGTIKVLEDLASPAAGYDGRSHGRVVVDAIEAVIEGRATKDQESYTIAGRSLNRTPIADLLKLRDRYIDELKREDQAESVANGLASGRIVLTRFS